MKGNDHADHCKKVTANRLRKKTTVIIGPGRCRKKIGVDLKQIMPGGEISLGDYMFE